MEGPEGSRVPQGLEPMPYSRAGDPRPMSLLWPQAVRDGEGVLRPLGGGVPPPSAFLFLFLCCHGDSC